MSRDVLLGHPCANPDTYPLAYGLPEIAEDVYVRRGASFVAVGQIREMSIHTDPIDMTDAQDDWVRLRPDVPRVEGLFVGPVRSARR